MRPRAAPAAADTLGAVGMLALSNGGQSSGGKRSRGHTRDEGAASETVEASAAAEAAEAGGGLRSAGGTTVAAPGKMAPESPGATATTGAMQPSKFDEGDLRTAAGRAGDGLTVQHHAPTDGGSLPRVLVADMQRLLSTVDGQHQGQPAKKTDELSTAGVCALALTDARGVLLAFAAYYVVEGYLGTGCRIVWLQEVYVAAHLRRPKLCPASGEPLKLGTALVRAVGQLGRATGCVALMLQFDNRVPHLVRFYDAVGIPDISILHLKTVTFPEDAPEVRQLLLGEDRVAREQLTALPRTHTASSVIEGHGLFLSHGPHARALTAGTAIINYGSGAGRTCGAREVEAANAAARESGVPMRHALQVGTALLLDAGPQFASKAGFANSGGHRGEHVCQVNNAELCMDSTTRSAYLKVRPGHTIRAAAVWQYVAPPRPTAACTGPPRSPDPPRTPAHTARRVAR